MTADEEYLRESLRLATLGMERGEGGPFGALVVRGTEVLGRGWNRVLATNDPTAHAEVVAIREACGRVRSYWLADCTLYSSCEPCPMCLAAAYWARIPRLVFAAGREDAAAIGFADRELYRQLVLPPGTRSMEVRQLLADEAREVMRRWPALAAGQVY
ncbi:MAG: tRNA-specific adenosine deaminase [Desulfobulbaceae bacterium A2]|nr:MAG: tRNA-specific adenosine deaminase [Desulfobulbaceae bacterium A2]